MIVSSALEDTAAARKARGAFFTPPSLARFVVQWALRSSSDNVLEPSCGEAAFLLAAAEQIGELAAEQPALTGLDADPVLAKRGHLDGVELHEPSAQRAEDLLRGAGHRSNVEAGDFFDVEPTGTYDAVVGNPPYVRFQDFTGDARARSREAALRAQVPISDLASSWAAFTVHAALFCKPGGRLGLVLPAELLSVNYASGVRRFLMERFATVRLVLFTERVFPGVLEEVVLLLADGYQRGPARHCELVQARNAEELVDAPRPAGAAQLTSGSRVDGPAVRTWTPDPIDGKWTTSLMPGHALEDYKAVLAAGAFTGLQTWGETTLGMVTGNNKYFALTRAQAAQLGLEPDELLPLSPPGSRHLRGLRFSAAAHTDLTWQGSATLLFRPPGEPSAAAQAYIAQGEADQVDRAYKCRVRKPWWRVPWLPPADMLLTCMNADTPRLTTNSARVHHLNSVHGVYLRPEHRETGMDLLPLAALNSMTLLGAETVGRSYGGGMLKLEPREADLLPVPTPTVVAAAAAELRAISPQVAAKLRSPRGLLEAVRLVDDALLVGNLHLRRPQVRALRDAHSELSARRAARGKPAR